MRTLLILLLVTIVVESHGQSGNPERERIGNELFTMDSLVFERAFNHCDTLVLEDVIPEDFEFYHDQSGVVDSRKDFLASMGSLCRMSYKPLRKVVKGSLQVFPLYSNGELYGAIQTGEHTFWAIEGNLPMYQTSAAKFTHLWLRREGKWQLSRVLSYDHQTAH